MEEAEAKRIAEEEERNRPFDWSTLRVDVSVKTALPHDHYPPENDHDKTCGNETNSTSNNSDYQTANSTSNSSSNATFNASSNSTANATFNNSSYSSANVSSNGSSNSTANISSNSSAPTNASGNS